MTNLLLFHDHSKPEGSRDIYINRDSFESNLADIFANKFDSDITSKTRTFAIFLDNGSDTYRQLANTPSFMEELNKISGEMFTLFWGISNLSEDGITTKKKFESVISFDSSSNSRWSGFNDTIKRLVQVEKEGNDETSETDNVQTSSRHEKYSLVKEDLPAVLFFEIEQDDDRKWQLHDIWLSKNLNISDQNPEYAKQTIFEFFTQVENAISKKQTGELSDFSDILSKVSQVVWEFTKGKIEAELMEELSSKLEFQYAEKIEFESISTLIEILTILLS